MGWFDGVSEAGSSSHHHKHHSSSGRKHSSSHSHHETPRASSIFGIGDPKRESTRSIFGSGDPKRESTRSIFGSGDHKHNSSRTSFFSTPPYFLSFPLSYPCSTWRIKNRSNYVFYSRFRRRRSQIQLKRI